MQKKAVALVMILAMIIPIALSPKINFLSQRNKMIQSKLVSNVTQSKKMQTTFRTSVLSFQVKILFDEAHDQYFDSNSLSDFLADIQKEFGARIVINTDPLDSILLDQYDIILLMDPNSNLTKSEVSALQSYLENVNGSILVAGTWYKYFEPWTVNFTTKYGVDWYDASTYDATNNAGRDYYPLVHNWANTTIARFVSNNSNFEVAVSGTAIKITGTNDSTKIIYRVGIGDNDSYILLEDGKELHLNESLDYFVAVDLTSGGRFFAAGSSQLLRNDFYASYDNKPFALRVIHWLLSEGLEVSTFEAPSELYVGETGYVNFTIRNNEAIIARNVKIGIELGNELGLKNDSFSYVVGDLAPGEEKAFTWEINGTSEGLSNITVKVWCDNLPGFSKGAEINVKLPSVELEVVAKPNKILLSLRNNFTLEITARAPRIFDVSNVVIDITLPSGLSTSNATTINVGSMSAGEIKTFKLLVGCSVRGVYEILVSSQGDYSGGPLKAYTTTIEVYVYDAVILFDQGHNQYYDADRMHDLIDLLYEWGYVYINNGTMTEENLTGADIVVIPNIEAPLSDDEITLIKNYIDEGGALIIMGTWYNYLNTTWMNNITQEYGIIWEAGLIWDEEANVGGNENITLISEFSESILAQILLKDITSLAFSYSTYLSVSGDAIPIIYGNPTTRVNTSEGLLDISGEEIIVAAVYQNDKNGKILALGSTGLFAYDLDDNDIKFAENILNWILGPKILEDTEPPAINITELENPYINAGELTITWSASDNKEITFFVVYLDDVLEGTVGASINEYTFSDLSDGNHVARVYAVDAASLYSYDEIVFTVDTQAPTINVITPEPGSTVYAGNIELEFELTDASGIAKVEIYIDGQLNKTIDNPGSHVVTEIYIDELGGHTISIVAYDLAGNSNTAIIDITVEEKPAQGPNMYYILIAAIVIIAAVIGFVVYSKRRG